MADDERDRPVPAETPARQRPGQGTQRSDAQPRAASFGATMKAVFWSFFGVRKRRDYEDDAARLNPVHVILGALLGVALFIGILLVAVRFAVAK
ncbi:DUF2970 domain-containing protein [Massilia forsythiae]|uniref:DUF2970 domain-containing protein n=2 Tax=Massilia forsythiae TaxID=2728020 RepID=A0A7Z2VUM1_9BURK|nr:DUF2970 domain-containing protein [Massilia forsythiae]